MLRNELADRRLQSIDIEIKKQQIEKTQSNSLIRLTKYSVETIKIKIMNRQEVASTYVHFPLYFLLLLASPPISVPFV